MSKTINSLLPCSKQSLYQEVNIHLPSSLREQEQKAETYELPHYHPNKNTSLLPSRDLNVCTLASINKDNKIQINQQALNFISLHSQFEIIYCGVYGSRKSGKSTLIDSLLNVDPSKQIGFEAQGRYDNKGGLKIHKKPLQVGQNKRLFLIEYSKAFQTPQLTQPQQKLLDILIFVSNFLILMVSKQGTLNIITKQISRSASRLKFNLKDIHFWPQNAYIVNTYNAISKNIGSIDSYFPRVSLVLWVKGEPKPLLSLINDLSSTSCAKSFRSITSNFHIMKKVLVKLEQEQNLTHSQSINVEGIFQSIYQQLSNEYLLYHYQLYEGTLQQYFSDEKPYSIDYLIQSFEKSRNIILTHFKQNHINKEFTEVQMDKLQDYIGQRERLINEVNKKKNRYLVHQTLQSFPNFKNIQSQTEIANLISTCKQLNRAYQHSGVQEYAEAFHLVINNMERNTTKARKRESEQLSSYTKQLQQRILQAKQQLAKAKEKSNASNIHKREFQSLQNKNEELKDKATKIIRQIEVQKKSFKHALNTKLSSEQAIDKMLQTIRQLEQTVRQNNKKKQQIQRQYDFNPQIQRLNRKLQKLQRNMNGEGSKLQSILHAEALQSKITAENRDKNTK